MRTIKYLWRNIYKCFKLGVVMHTFKPSAQKARADGSLSWRTTRAETLSQKKTKILTMVITDFFHPRATVNSKFFFVS